MKKKKKGKKSGGKETRGNRKILPSGRWRNKNRPNSLLKR